MRTAYPAATPRKTEALAMAFFVWPPTLPETIDNPSTNVAFEAPVIPAKQIKQNDSDEVQLRHTVSNEPRSLWLGPCNHREANNRRKVSSRHKVCPVTLWQSRVDVDSEQNDQRNNKPIGNLQGKRECSQSQRDEKEFGRTCMSVV